MQLITKIVDNISELKELLKSIHNKIQQDSIFIFFDTNIHIDSELNPSLFQEKIFDRISFLKDFFKTNSISHKYKAQFFYKCYSITNSYLIAYEEKIGEINY